MSLLKSIIVRRFGLAQWLRKRISTWWLIPWFSADELRDQYGVPNMKVERFSPDPETEPRHWVRHDQAFAMMLRPGSIEWGSKRSALEKFDYGAGDLALCDRHVGEWVGLMNVTHLQLGISDAALMACSDGAYGEVELRASRKFCGPAPGCDGCGCSCGDGCRLSERAAVSGFCRTGDGRSAGQWSCSKAPSGADIRRRTGLSALAKD